MPSEELEVNVVPGVKYYAPGTMSTYNPPFGQSAIYDSIKKKRQVVSYKREEVLQYLTMSSTAQIFAS